MRHASTGSRAAHVNNTATHPTNACNARVAMATANCVRGLVRCGCYGNAGLTGRRPDGRLRRGRRTRRVIHSAVVGAADAVAAAVVDIT